MAAVAAARARRQANWIEPWLPAQGAVLDLGSGTGHLAAELVARGRRVVCCDVADMHAVGSSPVLFDGARLPFPDRAFAAATAVHVLQYAADPSGLLAEVRRVAPSRVIVMQSICRGPLSCAVRRAEERLTGAWAYRLARRVGFVPPDRWGSGAPLAARRRILPADLRRWSAEAGLQSIRGRLGAPAPLSTMLLPLERRRDG